MGGGRGERGPLFGGAQSRHTSDPAFGGYNSDDMGRQQTQPLAGPQESEDKQVEQAPPTQEVGHCTKEQEEQAPQETSQLLAGQETCQQLAGLPISAWPAQLIASMFDS